MSWLRIEDRMPSGPKFDRIPSSAGWLHVCALGYASEHVTDGFIPAGRVYKLTNDPPRVVDQAVAWLTTPRPGQENPLWHVVEGGWVIHDYDDPEYGNATRAGAAAQRRSKQEAGRAGGQASVEARRKLHGTAQPKQPEAPLPKHSEAPPEAPASSQPEAPRFEAEEAAPNPRPVPSRPIPPVPSEPPLTVVRGVTPPASDGEPDPVAEQVEQLCQRMQDLVAERAKRPQITPAWRHDARLLLTRDRRPFDEAIGLMEWAAAEPFWRRNVLGIPKFREQYDRLRMQRDDEPQVGGPRYPASGAAGERLTPNSRLARRIEQELQQRRAGGAL